MEPLVINIILGVAGFVIVTLIGLAITAYGFMRSDMKEVQDTLNQQSVAIARVDGMLAARNTNQEKILETLDNICKRVQDLQTRTAVLEEKVNTK